MVASEILELAEQVSNPTGPLNPLCQLLTDDPTPSFKLLWSVLQLVSLRRGLGSTLRLIDLDELTWAGAISIAPAQVSSSRYC